jgi:hypothetical protein
MTRDVIDHLYRLNLPNSIDPLASLPMNARMQKADEILERKSIEKI